MTPPIKGALWQGVLPGVLRQLYVSRATGPLTFRRGEEQRGVRWRQGNIVSADTNVRAERMGELMVSRGVLSEAQLKRASGFVMRDKKRLGQVLLEIGALDKAGLEEALADHVRHVLSRVFTWPDGEYEFVEQPDAPFSEDENTLRLSTGELILEAARVVQDPDVIRYNLGDIDRVLALSNDPLLRFQRITLGAVDGYVLSRIDGTLSAREVMQMVPLENEECQRVLFGLLSTGVLEYAGGAPKARPATPPPKPPSRPPPPRAPLPPPPAENGPVSDAPPELVPPAAVSSAEQAPTAQLPDPSANDPRRLEILDAWEDLKAKNHFEVLGIAPEATDAQVREAYFRLARRFHPDVHHRGDLADLRDKVEAVFIRLGEAYEVLRNPRIRASYERELKARSGQAAPAVPAAEDPEELARAAEKAIGRAARSVAEERYWEAIQLLEPAIHRVQGKVLQKGRVLLARAYARNPNWVKQGEELLLTVLQEDPKNAAACLSLAEIYRTSGLKSRTASMYRRLLEIEPDNEEARTQLEGLVGPEPPAERPGLLKRLFKKED